MKMASENVFGHQAIVCLSNICHSFTVTWSPQWLIQLLVTTKENTSNIFSYVFSSFCFLFYGKCYWLTAFWYVLPSPHCPWLLNLVAIPSDPVSHGAAAWCFITPLIFQSLVERYDASSRSSEPRRQIRIGGTQGLRQVSFPPLCLSSCKLFLDLC